jgi:hypothetical protein
VQPGCTRDALSAENGSGSSDEEQRQERTKRVPMQIPEKSNSSEQSGESAAAPISVVRGATGPRTQRGKQKSKSNALKHGIFSKAVLLKEEPREEFNSLLRGLRNDFRPEGTFEGILVENLATSLWRKRRLLIAEGAEIRKGTEFLIFAYAKNQDSDATLRFELESLGLLSGAENPIVLKKCLELLEILEESIEKDGFNEQNDKPILTQLYGNPLVNKVTITPAILYSCCTMKAPSNENGSQEDESPSPASLRSMFLKILHEEIDRLKRFGEQQALVDSNRIEIESLRANVPDAPQLDRLLRYEAILQRDFDRTLSQLEWQQRIRKGQPVSPTLNLQVSS